MERRGFLAALAGMLGLAACKRYIPEKKPAPAMLFGATWPGSEWRLMERHVEYHPEARTPTLTIRERYVSRDGLSEIWVNRIRGGNVL